MRKTIMLALLAGSLVGAGAAVGVTQAEAQAAPPPGMAGPGMHRPMEEGPRGQMAEAGPRGPMGEDGPRGPMGGPMRRMGGMMRRMRQFALVYPTADRALSGPDVQKIAEAFLLFNGNHSWKVTEVTEEQNRVTFAIATPDGTAIAHFAMDRHNGRPERIG